MGCLNEVSMSDFKTTFKSSSLILLYEMIGTAMMTCLVVNYYNIKLEEGGKGDDCGLLLGMFVTIMFSARISGSRFNPCITLGFMFGDVKHQRFDKLLGILYLVA